MTPETEGGKMTERKYSVSEIDRMRAALWKRLKRDDPFYTGFYIRDHSLYSGPYDTNFVLAGDKRESDRAAIEDQLRTYMLNSTEPEELEARSAKPVRSHAPGQPASAIYGHRPDASFDDSMAGAQERRALLSNVADEVAEAIRSKEPKL